MPRLIAQANKLLQLTTKYETCKKDMVTIRTSDSNIS